MWLKGDVTVQKDRAQVPEAQGKFSCESDQSITRDQRVASRNPMRVQSLLGGLSQTRPES